MTYRRHKPLTFFVILWLLAPKIPTQKCVLPKTNMLPQGFSGISFIYKRQNSSLGTCASDERIKKDVHAFDLGLTALLGMKPVKFKYNGLAGFAADGQEQLGVIAQDIELTAPELVKRQLVQLRKDDREKTEIKVVDYGAFIYVVINAIKELSDKWSKESAEIQQLKAENAQIKAYLCQTTPAAPFCK